MLCFFAISESEKAKCRIFQSTAPLVVVRVENSILNWILFSCFINERGVIVI